jgi:hypothetical protein
MELLGFYTRIPSAYKQYLNDGEGRDTYVSVDYGGFIKTALEPDIFKRKGTVSPRRYVKPAPKKISMPINYHSDGSGRDYYIACNNGGLTATTEYGGKKNTFQRSLRNGEKPLIHDAFTLRMSKWTDPRYRSPAKAICVQKVIQRLYNSL